MDDLELLTTTRPDPGSCRMVGCEVSLYSGKARSYLRRRGVPFDEIQSTRKVVNGFVHPNTGLRMVPVVQLANGDVVQDTTAIIDRFEHDAPRCYPTDPVCRFVSLLLEVYGDEWLLMPAMHYRWAYKRKNMPLVLREFGALVAPELPRAGHFVAGVALAAYFGGGYPASLIKARRHAVQVSSHVVIGSCRRGRVTSKRAMAAGRRKLGGRTRA